VEALGFRGYLPHLHEGCAWHTSPTTTPPLQVAVSPGRHVMLHAAQRPTAGALHPAPVSAFFAAAAFFFSLASAGLEARRAASIIKGSDLVIFILSMTRPVQIAV
jgi:hypothetical protein